MRTKSILKGVIPFLICTLCFSMGTFTVTAVAAEGVEFSGLTTVTATVKSEEDLLRFKDGSVPDSALLNVGYHNGVLTVTNGSGEPFYHLGNAVTALSSKGIVPILYVSGQETAVSAAEFLQENNIIDAMLVCDDAQTLYLARQIATKVTGVLAVSQTHFTATELVKLRDDINGAWARAVIFPQNVEKSAVDFLFERCITVWIRSDGTVAQNYGAVVKGCHGIVSNDYKTTFDALSKMPKNAVTRVPQIAAHGGMPVRYQPNSLRGYMDAYENGKADIMENDLHMTSDGVVVLLHGTGVYGQQDNGDFIDDIAAQTTGTGKIHEMTWRQLNQYKIDGYKNFPQEPILDLETYLQYFQDKPTRHFMEMKRQMQIDMVKPVVDLIQKYGMQDRMNIITYWEPVATEMRRQLPEVSVLLLVDNGSVIITDKKNEREGWLSLLEKLNKDNLAYSPNYKTFTEEQMRNLAKRGIQTYKWTYLDPNDFETAYTNNYNSITTDFALWAAAFDVKIDFSGDLNLGTSIDESFAVRGTVTNKSGESREKIPFDVKIIEGDIKLYKTSGGKYYADKSGKAKAVVHYPSKNTFSYLLEGGGGEKTVSYNLVFPRIIDVTVKGASSEPEDDQPDTIPDGKNDDISARKTGCNGSVTGGASIAWALFCLGASALLLKKRFE